MARYAAVGSHSAGLRGAIRSDPAVMIPFLSDSLSSDSLGQNG